MVYENIPAWPLYPLKWWIKWKNVDHLSQSDQSRNTIINQKSGSQQSRCWGTHHSSPGVCGGHAPSLGWWHEHSPGFLFKDIPVRKPWKTGEIETSWFPADDLYVIDHESNPSRSTTTLKLRGTTERKATSRNSCSSLPAQYQRNEPSAWERRQRSAQCCVGIRTVHRGRKLATNHLCSNLETSTSHAWPGCLLWTFRIKSQITDQLILSTHSA